MVVGASGLWRCLCFHYYVLVELESVALSDSDYDQDGYLVPR